MGRIITAALLFYVGFYMIRSLTRVFRGFNSGTKSAGETQNSRVPWRDEDIEDADFEDINNN